MFHFRTQRWIGVLLLMCVLLPVYASADAVLERVFADIAFQHPLALVPAPNQSDVWYVVEQEGRVIRLSATGFPGRASLLKSSVFIDIRDRVESGPNEAGLLGMAFDPDFNQSGRFYLSYTRDNGFLESVLSRFESQNDGLTATTRSEQIIFQVRQPFSNHNGGDIHFGPDGYLYYGLGDGGSGGDPQGNAQNTQSLLGKMLRLDVSGDAGYQVPPDNPFVKGGGKPEIYAYGLRNPWRWSFDRITGELWLADVGQDAWEEVNRIAPGGNYGWNIREGNHCYSDDCERPELIEPLAEYSHKEGCSITGGYVYRGKAVPELKGIYIYGDYCSGTIWGLNADSNTSSSQVLFKTDLNISSFGEDNDGEIYVIDLNGRIFKIVHH